MSKIRYLFVLLCFISLIYSPFAAAPAAGMRTTASTVSEQAAPAAPLLAPIPVDPQLWEAMAASPAHLAEYWVSLGQPEANDPAAAIDAQFQLVEVLELLQKAGGVQDYTAYYGQNLIAVTGTPGSAHFLAAWPSVSRIDYSAPEAAHLAQKPPELEAPQASGVIEGRVTGPDGSTPLAGISITVYRQTTPVNWKVERTTASNAGGGYSIGSLPSGFYRIKFEDPAGNHARQYYNNTTDFSIATIITVTDGKVTPDINARMTLAGKISGKITALQGGSALSDIVATAWWYNGTAWASISSAVSASDGTYTIGALPAGAYRVRFSDIYTPARYLSEWWDNKIDINSANDIAVTASLTAANKNASLGGYGWMEGTLKSGDGASTLAGVNVDIFEFDSGFNDWVLISYTNTDSAGKYRANGLVTRNYRVHFSDPLGSFIGEYYSDKPDILSANDVHVDLGSGTVNINANLTLQSQTLQRSLGLDWNLFSIPLTPLSPSLPGVLSSLGGNYASIWGYDGCNTNPTPWRVYDPTAPFGNTLTGLNPPSGYWIQTTQAGSLSVTGTQPLQTTIPLCSGWNLIGYPSLVIRPVGNVLAGISGKYNLVYTYKADDQADPWKLYNPSLPAYANDLNNFEPWQGYWIRMTASANLVISGR